VNDIVEWTELIVLIVDCIDYLHRFDLNRLVLFSTNTTNGSEVPLLHSQTYSSRSIMPMPSLYTHTYSSVFNTAQLHKLDQDREYYSTKSKEVLYQVLCVSVLVLYLLCSRVERLLH